MKGRLMTQKRAAPFDLGTYLVKVRGGDTAKEYRKKHTIFLQGSPADAVFYIAKGKVKLTVLSARGKEAVVAILGSGDFFGEGSLAPRRPCPRPRSGSPASDRRTEAPSP